LRKLLRYSSLPINWRTKKPDRKGLESPTGGEKTGSEPGTYTADDIDRLMKTDYRKFEKLIKSGVIDPDKIR